MADSIGLRLSAVGGCPNRDADAIRIMVRHGTTSEYLLTQKTAEEYRARGYEVLTEASLDFLPGSRLICWFGKVTR